MAANRGPQLLAVMAVLLTLAWLSMSLRTFVRVRMLRSFGLDDWLAAAALVLFTAYGAIVFQSVHHGVGRHVSELLPHQIPAITKDFYLLQALFLPTTALIKLSVSALLLRIAVTKTQRYIIYGQVLFTILYTIVAEVLSIASCRPIGYFWTRYDPHNLTSGTCVVGPSGLAIMLYLYSGQAVITDFIYAILPWFIIRGSTLTPRNKISIIAVLGLGMLAGISAVIRTPFVHNITTTHDITYTTADLSIWGSIEPGLGLIAASVGTLRPLFRNFLAKSRTFESSSPRGASAWTGSRRGYVRNTTTDAHPLRDMNSRDKGGGVCVIRSANSVGDSGLSQSTDKRSIPNGSTRGLVVLEDSCGGRGSGDDPVSEEEEEEPGVEWDTGILKTTEFSVQREGTDVDSVI